MIHSFSRALRAAFAAPSAAALMLFSLVFAPAALRAQAVNGTVVRGIDDAPILGVVVLLLDDAETVRARSLSDMQGRFVVRAPAPGTYRLRTLRIGFLPWTSAAIDVRRDTTVRLALDQLPVRLPTVTASETADCKSNPAEGLASAILWDEARTAILAADITIRELSYRFDMMLHSRKLDTRPPPLLLESVFGRVRSEGVQPWTSFAPETLETRGYVTPTDSGLRYVAPDLTVLLSPYFTRSHCFTMRPPSAAAPTHIALEFAPLATVRRSEIKGVLLFEADTRKLAKVEFSYVNVPETVKDMQAGGEIEFAQLTNGAWILPRWLIRAPIPVRSALADTVRRAGTAVNTWRSDYFEVPQTSRMRVTGGDLLAVRAKERPEVLWSRATSVLDIDVVSVDAGRLVPSPGAAAAFSGSDQQVVSDGQGRVRFDGLVGGDYAVEITTPYYSAFDVEPERIRVRFDQTPRTQREQVRVKTLLELATESCGDKPGHAVLMGSVARRDGSVVVGGSVVARIPRGATSNLDEARTARARTTIEGRYAICDIPVGVEVFLTVAAPDGSRVSQSTFIDKGEKVAFYDLVFPERRP
ncbi:MAG: carboxypeptidase regulatory-like domain-containing protein [Gemmatimonadaceae bacterium]|nr:carboxypeptidase regulatory-like domain-containing protein [Gemmatimonadaceae bacterium]